MTTTTKPKPTPTPKQALATLRKNMTDAFLKHAQESDPDAVFELVVKDIKQYKDQLMMELLGVTTRFGRAEVDHCNQRSTATALAVAQPFAERLKPIIEGQMDKLFAKVDSDPKHPIRQAIAKELLNMCDGYRLREMINRRAEEMIVSVVNKEVDRFRNALLD